MILTICLLPMGIYAYIYIYIYIYIYAYGKCGIGGICGTILHLVSNFQIFAFIIFNVS